MGIKLRAADRDRITADTIRRHTGAELTDDDARALRLAAKTLHRWAELECGGGNEHATWCIERDEADGDRPYLVTYPNVGKPSRRRMADLERGALWRVDEVCKRYGLQYYYQRDPRGPALYVASKPMTHSNYSNVGVAV